jgi:hypothetical protein
MTPKKQRISRTNKELTQSMEAHLYFLWEARQRYPEQPDRYKQMATELRVLVCKTRTNQPLLLDLMDRYGFSYEVQPPGPPLDKQPITLVDDLAPEKLAESGKESANLGDEATLKKQLDKQIALRRPLPFREYVDRALAVFIRPHAYSYRELTLAIAQQLGSSHEDSEVDESIVQLANMYIGGHAGHVAPLMGFANRVITVGSKFLEFLHLEHGYKPQYFKLPNPPPE